MEFDDLVYRYRLRVGDEVILNGTLHTQARGGKIGKTFSNYHCYISDIRPGCTYKYLLGDDYTDELGWVDGSSLEPVTKMEYL